MYSHSSIKINTNNTYRKYDMILYITLFILIIHYSNIFYNYLNSPLI